jgi:copper(I)-binding protein
MRRRIGNHRIWLLAASLLLLGGAAGAETYTVGSIEIGNPWARATPKGAPVGGAYMTITNKGAEATWRFTRCPWTTASCPCAG